MGNNTRSVHYYSLFPYLIVSFPQQPTSPMPRSSAINRTKFGCVMVESCASGGCRSRPKIMDMTRDVLKHRRRKEAKGLSIHPSHYSWPKTFPHELVCRPDHSLPKTQRASQILITDPSRCHKEESVRSINLRYPFPFFLQTSHEQCPLGIYTLKIMKKIFCFNNLRCFQKLVWETENLVSFH